MKQNVRTGHVLDIFFCGGPVLIGALMVNHSITQILEDIRGGQPGAEDRLFGRVYDELRAMARVRLAHERHPSLGPTDLVHDAALRVSDENLQNRRHLFFAYGRAMKQILIEVARKRAVRDRATAATASARDQYDRESNRGGVLEAAHVGELLDRLHDERPLAASIVLLKFFGGLREVDVAEVLGINERTVRREWAAARGWLRSRASP